MIIEWMSYLCNPKAIIMVKVYSWLIIKKNGPLWSVPFFISYYSLFLFDVGLFQSETLLLVNHLEEQTKNEGMYTIKYTAAFKKGYKRMKKRGADLTLIGTGTHADLSSK